MRRLLPWPAGMVERFESSFHTGADWAASSMRSTERCENAFHSSTYVLIGQVVPRPTGDMVPNKSGFGSGVICMVSLVRWCRIQYCCIEYKMDDSDNSGLKINIFITKLLNFKQNKKQKKRSGKTATTREDRPPPMRSVPVVWKYQVY